MAGTMSDEEDMAWGEQAQIAVERELNPPKGPGGNPKVDRRSTTGSNFMRCLPDQATSLTQLTPDRTPFLGGSTAIVQPQCQRRRRSKFGMHLCRAERDQPGGWAEVGGADWSEGAAGGSGGPYQDSMLMSHADELEGGADGGSWRPYQGSTLMRHNDGSGGSADGGPGAADVEYQACNARQSTNSIHSQSNDCSSSSFSGHTYGFFFSNRRDGQRGAGHCPCAVNSRMTTGANSRFCHASEHNMLSSKSCDMGCGCSHHSNSGRSCIGSRFMQSHAHHDCISSLQHNRMATLYASSVQQAQFWAHLYVPPVCSHVGRNVATVPSRLVQSRLHSRRGLSSLSSARCSQQGFAKSCAQQRQVATRLWL